jgi:1,4-dihydroxy-2-naphthoate octaprenyltransferase
MRTLGAAAQRFALATAACAAALVAAGAIFAVATGKQTQPSIAAALFIGAALLIVFNALGEASSRDRGVDIRTGMTYPGAGSWRQGSLGWALVGVVLIGFGVLILVV